MRDYTKREHILPAHRPLIATLAHNAYTAALPHDIPIEVHYRWDVPGRVTPSGFPVPTRSMIAVPPEDYDAVADWTGCACYAGLTLYLAVIIR